MIKIKVTKMYFQLKRVVEELRISKFDVGMILNIYPSRLFGGLA